MPGNDAHNERGIASQTEPGNDLSARLKRLGSDLDATRGSAKPEAAPGGLKPSDTNAVGQAVRLSAEFVASVAAGGIVGWLIDRLVGSAPWGLIVFVILGFCAGMLNLMRASGAVKSARTTGPKT